MDEQKSNSMGWWQCLAEVPTEERLPAEEIWRRFLVLHDALDYACRELITLRMKLYGDDAWQSTSDVKREVLAMVAASDEDSETIGIVAPKLGALSAYDIWKSTQCGGNKITDAPSEGDDD
jgi:hypothetical protein